MGKKKPCQSNGHQLWHVGMQDRKDRDHSGWQVQAEKQAEGHALKKAKVPCAPQLRGAMPWYDIAEPSRQWCWENCILLMAGNRA